MNRIGVTLVELLVVIAILGVMASVSGVALPRPTATARDTIADEAQAVRRRSLASARVVPDTLRAPGGHVVVRAWPSGRVLVDSINAVRADATGRAP